jgi:hypothetical protein
MRRSRPWGLAAISTGTLLVALVVPDEPFHLSGVFVSSGLALAGVGLIVALVQSFRETDPAARRSSRWAALWNMLAIMTTFGVLIGRLMSEFSE